MLLRFIGSTAYNSRLRLDNVNGTHLVQASGRLVLQKDKKNFNSYCVLIKKLNFDDAAAAGDAKVLLILNLTRKIRFMAKLLER